MNSTELTAISAYASGGAVRAAGMVGGHEKARAALRRNPHVNALLASSLRDVHTLGFYLKGK